MWHEARRQERRIRGMLVDYRRRAERRRDFYEKIKADPTQFLQVHGRQCKIHLDPAVAAAADSPAAMMPWQGQADNLIDRFDVRAHLDQIPPVKKEEETEITLEERQLNYERYRIISQNSFLGITEEKFLKQLHLEEQFGYTENKVKKERTTGAAIGFNYEDGTGTSQQASIPETCEEESDDNSDSDLDVDLSINVSKIDSVQAHELNKHGHSFGMSSNDFYSFLTNDLEEAESYKLAKEEEAEKVLYSGRKSRRERRAHREKRLANRVLSPPSYAAKASPNYASLLENKSPSRSPSPENAGKITYITSFGDEEETQSSSKPTYADRVKYGRSKKGGSTERTVYISKRSNSRDRSYGKKRRSRTRSRSRRRTRSRSRGRYKQSRSRSRTGRTYRRRRSKSSSSSSSRSRSRVKSMTKSRSRSRSRPLRKSKSPSSSPAPMSPVNKTPAACKSSKSKSKSPSPQKESPPKVVTRYYGRRRSDQSSSEIDTSDNDDNDNKGNNSSASNEKWSSHGNTGSAIKKSAPANLSIQEKLKRKRQALLAKQFKADKIAEQIKTEREKQEQQNRKEELREMAIKLRRRQREKRHAYDSNRSSSSSSDSKSQCSPHTDRAYPKSRSPSPSRRDEREKHSKRREPRERSRDRRGYSPEQGKSREPESGKSREDDRSRHSRERRASRSRSRDRSRNRNNRVSRGRSRDRERNEQRCRSDRGSPNARVSPKNYQERRFIYRSSDRRERKPFEESRREGERKSDSRTESKDRPIRALVDY